MPRLLLLMPTASYRTGDFMEAASRPDLDVVVASNEGQPLADLVPGRSLTTDFADPQHGADQIARFADAYPLDAIVAVDDAGALLASHAGALLKLPMNSVPAVESTRNKALLRERLAAAGLPSPAYRVCRLEDDATQVAAELVTQHGFPCVVKPLALAGSRGVMRADDPSAFKAAVQRLAALLSRPDVIAECGDLASQYLIEGYIPGAEVALEGLLTDGALHVLALFDKPDPLVGPFFEETIYVTPSRLPTAQQRTITARAEQAAAALDLRDGPIHIELRVTDNDAWPIDIAARTIGGHCARALRFADGGSLEELVLRNAVGFPVDTFDRESAASAVMMIPIPSAGRLEAIDGVDDARAIESVTEVTMTVRPGRTLVPLPEGGEYLGFIFAKSDTPQDAEKAVRVAHAALQFAIAPTDFADNGS